MGRATILSGGPDGLYAIRPLYNTAPLDRQIADLEAGLAKQLLVLGRAVLSLSLIEDEVEIARRAMNNLIWQWQQDLLNHGSPPEITPPTPDDPDTGSPWDPSDKAQEGPLFDAINAARTGAGKSALTRETDLDTAARRHVLDMSGARLMGHIGSDQSVPSSRVAATLYQADLVVELVSCGSLTAPSAVSEWAINSASPIYSDVATVVGVAYTYSTHHPATHLWVAVLAHPDPSPSPSPPTVTYPDDPAQKAATEQESGLEKIKPPETKGLPQPEKLSEAVRKFGIAAGKRNAASAEIARLIAEYAASIRRLDELSSIKAARDAESISAWCADLSEEIAAGTAVDTFEPPGYRVGNALHIAPYRSDPRSWSAARIGKLRDAATMTDAAALYAFAIEPGHYRWKPLWRYGSITAIQSGADTCNLTLETVNARTADHETLSLNASSSLSAVPISYMDCHSAAFEVGDRVIVLYEGQDRAHPKVIGFADHPRECGGWIESFDAAVYSLGANDPSAWTGLLVPAGDGWPISNAVPYTGVTGIRFQQWAAEYNAYESIAWPLVRANWVGGGFSYFVDPSTTYGTLNCYVTGNHHKAIVVNSKADHSAPSHDGYRNDGSFVVSSGSYLDISSVQLSNTIIFPDDCQDFLVGGLASFDFPIWLDWDTIEVDFTVDAAYQTVGAQSGYQAAWLQLFLWPSWSIYDVVGLSDNRHMGMYLPVLVGDNTRDAYPVGTTLNFVPFDLGDYGHGSNSLGTRFHDRYIHHNITHDYDHHVWSNNNPSPYNLGHATAPVGQRYYCFYDPTITTDYDAISDFMPATINGRHKYKVKRDYIDPEHDIYGLQIASGGVCGTGITVNSIRFYKKDAV